MGDRVHPSPKDILSVVSLIQAPGVDEFDPSPEEVEEIRASLAKEGAENLADDLRVLVADPRYVVLLDQVNAWVSEHMPDLTILFPDVVGAMLYLYDKRETSFEEVIRVRGDRHIADVIQEGTRLEIRNLQGWFALVDRIERRVARYKALKNAFNEIGREGRWGERGTTLILLLGATYDQLVLEDASIRKLGGCVWEDDEEADQERKTMRELRASVGESREHEHSARRAARIVSRRAAPDIPGTASPTCAEPGCDKTRVFFDDDGVGYCKRHGDERGIRPHGKVI